MGSKELCVLMLMQPFRQIRAGRTRSGIERDFKSVFIFWLLDVWRRDCIQWNLVSVKNGAIIARRILMWRVCVVIPFPGLGQAN
jgi:hypothetical protein